MISLTSCIITGKIPCIICASTGTAACISCTITGKTDAANCPISGIICITAPAITGSNGSRPLCNVFIIAGSMLASVSSMPVPPTEKAPFTADPTCVIIPHNLSKTATASFPNVFCMNPRTCSKWVDT